MKNVVAGVDEVGRGCLAGPVISAAVILQKGTAIKEIRDQGAKVVIGPITNQNFNEIKVIIFQNSQLAASTKHYE